MTKLQQRKFLRDLSRDVTKSLLASAGRWPAEWDGHELRALLAFAFDRETGNVSPRHDRRAYKTDRKRTDSFHHVCASKRIP